jgi:hypothetical protein
MIRVDRGSTILFNAGDGKIRSSLNRDITIDVHQPRETTKTDRSLVED